MKSEQRQGESFVYLLVTPDGYDPDETYPAVVLLHGYGANMSDLASLCPAIERERYIYVCPNAPIPVQIGPGKIGSPVKGSKAGWLKISMLSLTHSIIIFTS